MKKILCKCEFCLSDFEKDKNKYDWASRNGRRNFCSHKCSSDFSKTLIDVKCFTCQKGIKIRQKLFDTSENKRFFCSHSCSAKTSNAERKHNEETKSKISQSLIEHGKLNSNLKTKTTCCVICDKIFRSPHQDRKCCSKRCGIIYQFGTELYTKDDVVNQIIDYSKSNKGYSPQKRDFSSGMYHSAVKFFSSWSNAVKSCGLKPNPSKFQICRIKTLDGHMADSISEKTVDNTLFVNGFVHERNKRYDNRKDARKFNCDFYVFKEDLWIEYFGLYGQNEEYDEIVVIKTQMAKDLNLRWMYLTPDDLYPNNRVIEKVNMFLKTLENA